LKAADGVALETGGQGDAGGVSVAVTGMVFDGDEVVKGVVVVALAAAVNIDLFDQVVGGVPGEAVGLAVFVSQGLEASVGVVVKANLVAEGGGLAFVTVRVQVVVWPSSSLMRSIRPDGS